ncbi:MAG TPA: ResB protein required for cytochrome C biosynthesis, partial [Opitutaceae bacterium]
MKALLEQFREFFSSLRLTVALLVLSIILVTVATLDQVNLGIWAVQEKYFQTFFVLKYLPDSSVPIPVFPGGYSIGGMLLINLLCAHVERFKPQWRKLGISLTHAGIVLLLVGELFTGLFS